MKKLLFLIPLIYANSFFAQNTTIPDANFEQALINFGLDVPPINGLVPTANIDTLVTLNISNQNIADLTGIEDFDALKVLNCYNNQLTSLNVTQNLQLTTLRCSQNALTTLDVTQNTNLEILWCTENQLTNLNVTQNTVLTEFLCSSNQLTNLNVSQNLQLFNLRCNSNQISSLDVTMLANLGDLDCSDNNISTLDVTLNTGLLFLNCGRNLISTIDVSQNLMLISFRSFNSNNIQTIDLTNNTSLTFVDCAASFQLTELKVKNGNNVNVTYFRAEICPNLKCIYVDDKNASYLSSWIKDTSAHWVNDTLDCQNVTSFNEYDNKSNFLNIYPNPATNYAYFEFENLPAELIIYNMQRRIIFKEQIETKTYKLELSGFEKGVYLCGVFGNNTINKLIII